MAKSVTLADIAAKVGVSNVAVSRALAGKPGVSSELRDRIKHVAEELGYVSNTLSKDSESGTGNIGVVIPEYYYGFPLSFYGELYKKVVKELFSSHYYGILELLSDEDEQKKNIPKVIQHDKVDGVIFLGQMKKEYIAHILHEIDLPVVFMDAYVPGIILDTVISDGYYGACLLTEYLIGQGHRNIAFVGSVKATSSIADRYWGYRRALREYEIEFQPGWEIPDRDEKGKSFEQFFLDPSIDAYVCNSDYAAYIIIQNLEKQKKTVPGDVSVVGFDDFLPTGIGAEHAGITTYRVDMEKMASSTVSTLINKIRKEEYTKGIQMIPGELILRDSVRER